jgi:hypothetical protein
MDDVTTTCTYFAGAGSDNTARTLEIAKARADQLGIRSVVVASTSGATGRQAAELFQGRGVVIVSHATGFKGPNTQELTEDNRRAIEKLGARILTCQHAFGGVGRAVSEKLNTCEPEEIIACTLRIFGDATKVICEMMLMAADAGLIRAHEPAIGIAGTRRGADNTQSFFEMRVMEILCKPRFGP